MAGGTNLATKYSREVDERWTSLSQAQLVLSNDKYKFKGDKTVVVYSIPIAPLVDYTRSGTSRYGTPSDLARNVQTLTVSQDKGFTFIIDRGDEIQSEYVSNPGTALARQLREVVVPNFDTYCFAVMAQAAQDNGHYSSTAITKTNALEMVLNGQAHMADLNVPIDDCKLFVTNTMSNYLMLDNAFIRYGDRSQEMISKGQIGTVAGMEVIVVPRTKLPVGAAFMIVHRDAVVAPKQLEEFKIHDDPVGISGSLVEGRVIFDCFSLDEKNAGIYYHGGQAIISPMNVLTAASSSGKTSVIINEDKAASYNKWYYITGATKANLPTVTYGTAIDMGTGGTWAGAVELTAKTTEITPTTAHKFMAVVEVNATNKPQKYTTVKMNIG